MRRALALALLPAAALGACGGGGGGGAADPAGQFSATCAACHHDPVAGAASGDLPGGVIATRDEATIRAVIADGRNAMPGYSGSLDAATIDALARYLAAAPPA